MDEYGSDQPDDDDPDSRPGRGNAVGYLGGLPIKLPPPRYREFTKIKVIGYMGPGKYDRNRQLIIPMVIYDEYRDQAHHLMDSLGLPVKITIEKWEGGDLDAE